MKRAIPDSSILFLINAGWIELRDGEVWKLHATNRVWNKLSPTQHPISGRWRYNVRLGKKQRTIYRNRLFFLIRRRRVPKDNCDLDHRDHDTQNDDPDNIRELGKAENRRDNTHVAERECHDFFDDIIWMQGE